MRSILILAIAALLMVSAGAVLATPTDGWGGDKTNWTSVSGGYTASGFVYDPVNYEWNLGTENNNGAVSVTADIEMWMSMAYNATNFYLHIGQDPGANPSFDADTTGFLSSNNGQWLFVTKAEGQPPETGITSVGFVRNIFGGTSPANCPPIAVEWWLQDTGGWRLGQYSTGGNNNQLWGVTWLIDNGTAGYHPFDLKCRFKPIQYQPDGYYEMDPLVVASPEV